MEKSKGFDPNWHERVRKQDQNKYPKFVFEGNADLGFKALIKKVVRQFDFNAFSPQMRDFFQDLKKDGFKKVIHLLLANSSNEQNMDKKSRNNTFLKDLPLKLSLSIGEMVFREIPKDQIQQYLPFNDVRFLFKGTEIIVQFHTLKKGKSSQGIFWYSYLESTVEVNGKQYRVAFSRHAIKQICDRISPDGISYACLGDVYAYFEECVYFETCKLRDGNLAITFWDLCRSNRFWNYQYVEKVLGKENLISTEGYPYFRVGYCPVVIEDDFLIAKTLLFPGYLKTLEYECLLNSELSQAEKNTLCEKATKQDAKFLIETGDFSCIKWFHLNAIPQVIQTRKEIYAHLKTLPSAYYQNE